MGGRPGFREQGKLRIGPDEGLRLGGTIEATTLRNPHPGRGAEAEGSRSCRVSRVSFQKVP